jgi:hypothetical protein
MALYRDILENRWLRRIKLRIHNITTKSALKCGDEHWVLKKRDEERLEAS